MECKENAIPASPRIGNQQYFGANPRLCIPVLLKLHGLVFIHPEPKLFDKDKLICKNGVAQVEPEKMSWLLIATLKTICIRSQKGQAHALALVTPTRLTKRTLTTQEVLGMVIELPTPGMKNNEALGFSPAFHLATPKQYTKDLLDTIKPNHLPAKRRQAVRQMISKHCSM